MHPKYEWALYHPHCSLLHVVLQTMTADKFGEDFLRNGVLDMHSMYDYKILNIVNIDFVLLKTLIRLTEDSIHCRFCQV